MEEQKILSYFASFNHISKKIALREKSLIKYLGNRWTKYSPEQQEELLNDLYVPYSIRQLYPSKASDKEGNEKMKQCWPVLKLSSGEKIMVDENDVISYHIHITLCSHLIVNDMRASWEKKTDMHVVYASVCND